MKNKLKNLDDKNHSIKYWSIEVEDKLLQIMRYIEEGKKGTRYIYNLAQEALSDLRVVQRNQKTVEDMVYELIYGKEE